MPQGSSSKSIGILSGSLWESEQMTLSFEFMFVFQSLTPVRMTRPLTKNRCSNTTISIGIVIIMTEVANIHSY
jgi:hypothetical protein